MARCSFCGYEIERGTGKTVVQKDSTILHFCSNRCEKNMLKLHRNPLKVAWTLRFRKFRGKAKGAEAMVLEEEEKKAKEAKTPVFVDAGAKKEEVKKEEKAAEKK